MVDDQHKQTRRDHLNYSRGRHDYKEKVREVLNEEFGTPEDYPPMRRAWERLGLTK